MRTGARSKNTATLDKKEQYGNVDWKKFVPDKRQTWLTEGLHAEFETFIPLGSKEAKAVRDEAGDVIFKIYSRGVSTGRDAWARNFNRCALTKNITQMIDFYNEQVFKWERRRNRDISIDDFVVTDNRRISWSSG